MQPAEIVLRSGGRGMRENDGGVNVTKMYCKHICKYHSVSPVQLLYPNNNRIKKLNLQPEDSKKTNQ
jgi:hypothetical protein